MAERLAEAVRRAAGREWYSKQAAGDATVARYRDEVSAIGLTEMSNTERSDSGLAERYTAPAPHAAEENAFARPGVLRHGRARDVFVRLAGRVRRRRVGHRFCRHAGVQRA